MKKITNTKKHYRDFRKTRPNGGKWSAIDKINRHKLKMLILDGWTEKKIAEFFNITRIGYIKYKNRNPKFFAKVQDWREQAAKNVEKRLYKRAMGYDVEEETREQIPVKNKKTGQRKLITVKVFKNKKHIAGSVDAAKFILTNVQKERYKNRQDNNNMNMDGHIDDKEFADKFFGINEEEEVINE